MGMPGSYMPPCPLCVLHMKRRMIQQVHESSVPQVRKGNDMAYIWLIVFFEI